MKTKIIESRNKREGRYCGRNGYCRKTGNDLPRMKHTRQGNFWTFTLRDID